MKRLDKLNVYYNNRLVGTLALYQNRLAAFAYDEEWINTGFSISPFSLPLEQRVFMPKIDPFEGLFGVFSDSLPDGWGRLLVDRLLQRNRIDSSLLGNLDRLAIVGRSGMGALTYKPIHDLNANLDSYSYDTIATECKKILHDETSDKLDYIFAKGGSSGGARPKILTQINNEEWIIKYPSTYDPKNIGRQEYEYAKCAKKCGIIMEDIHLFPSELCDGYFGTKRFDVKSNNERIHMVSASGLLETSHRIPNLDYNLLMRLTLQLTGSMEECLKLYRLMCFNVFAHNRDDHSKNFTYQYIETEKKWILSPAYDLTYSNSIGGEHATTINGNGVNPGFNDLYTVAGNIGISTRKAKAIAEGIYEIVRSNLREYF